MKEHTHVSPGLGTGLGTMTSPNLGRNMVILHRLLRPTTSWGEALLPAAAAHAPQWPWGSWPPRDSGEVLMRFRVASLMFLCLSHKPTLSHPSPKAPPCSSKWCSCPAGAWRGGHGHNLAVPGCPARGTEKQPWMEPLPRAAGEDGSQGCNIWADVSSQIS